MPPVISSEKVPTPKRNCRTSTSCPAGVSAITFTQSGASITTKSRSVARTGWRNCTLCRSKMRVLTSVRRPRCSQRSGSANGGGFIGKNKNASRPQGEEAFKVFEKARGLFLRQLDLLADLQARRTDTRVHRGNVGGGAAMRLGDLREGVATLDHVFIGTRDDRLLRSALGAGGGALGAFLELGDLAVGIAHHLAHRIEGILRGVREGNNVLGGLVARGTECAELRLETVDLRDFGVLVVE